MAENNSGEGCYKSIFYLTFGGLGGLMLIVCLGGAFVQGVWELGETNNVQPEQVVQATVSTASSPVGVFLVACVAVVVLGGLALSVVGNIGR